MSIGSRDEDRFRVRGTSMSNTSGSPSDVTSQVQDAADQAKEKAGEIAGQAKQTTTERANEQKDRAVDSLGSLARAFGDVGNQLRDENPTIARYADMAADKIDQFAGQIGGRDVTDLLGDVEDYARRNPAVFIGGAFALGIVGARFLKSSRPSTSGWSASGASPYRASGDYQQAGARYSGYTGRDATPPRTSYRTAGYQQPTSPASYAPDQPVSRTPQAGRDAFGDADPSMTSGATRPGFEEDRHGTR